MNEQQPECKHKSVEILLSVRKVCPSIVKQEKTIQDFTAIPHVFSTSQDDGLPDMPDTDQDINPVNAKNPIDKALIGNFSSSFGSTKCLSVPDTPDLEPRNDSYNLQAVRGQGEATNQKWRNLLPDGSSARNATTNVK